MLAPDQGRQGGSLGRGRGCARERLHAAEAGKRHRGDQVGFRAVRLGTARAVGQVPAVMTDRPDRDGGRSVGRKRNAAARVAVLQSGPQGYEVEKARLASDQVQTDRVDMTALGKEARQGTTASIAILKLVIDFLTGGLVDNRDAITGSGPPAGFHRAERI